MAQTTLKDYILQPKAGIEPTRQSPNHCVVAGLGDLFQAAKHTAEPAPIPQHLQTMSLAAHVHVDVRHNQIPIDFENKFQNDLFVVCIFLLDILNKALIVKG